MTDARAPQQDVSTAGGLTVNVSARPVARAPHPVTRPAPVAVAGSRMQDLTRLLGTVTALVSVPAAGATGLLLAGPRACVAAAGVAGAVVMYGEHVSRYPSRRMPSSGARAAVCANCAGTHIGVVSARVRRLPARAVLQAWCVGCWTQDGRAAPVDAVWWLPASFSGTWDALDDVVDGLLPAACRRCGGRCGPVQLAVWVEGDAADTADLLCALCAQAHAEGPAEAARLGGVARTAEELRSLVEAAYLVREPLLDVIEVLDPADASDDTAPGRSGGSR